MDGSGELPSQEVTRRAPREAGPPDGAAPSAVAPPGETPPAAPAPARLLGRFVVLGELGRGGYGVVYRASDPTLDRPVAVKVLRVEGADAAARERLLREARAVARLGKHPHVVQVLEAGVTASGEPFVAMELCDGDSLERVLARRGPLPWREAAEVARKVALGLDHAHRHGLVHRDVKPSNVILDARGEPLVTDFGVAKDLAGGAATLTREGHAVGTPAFMSPEQAEALPVDARSDVYAAGALLFALVSGRAPFGGAPLPVVLARVIEGDVEDLSTAAPGVPRDLATVVRKAMARERAARYASAADLADDLRRVVAGKPCRARRPGPVGRIVAGVRRRPRNVLLVLALGLAALLAYRDRRMSDDERMNERLSALAAIETPEVRLARFDELIRDFPAAWRPHHARAMELRDMGLANRVAARLPSTLADAARRALPRFREAAIEFDHAISLEGKVAEARFWRAILRAEVDGDLRGAAHDLERVIELDPVGPLGSLARVALPDLARREPPGALDAAIGANLRLGILRFTRGALRLERGDAAGAREDFTQAVDRAPFCWQTQAALGRALAAAGEPDGAKDHLRAALLLLPEGASEEREELEKQVR